MYDICITIRCGLNKMYIYRRDNLIVHLIVNYDVMDGTSITLKRRKFPKMHVCRILNFYWHNENDSSKHIISQVCVLEFPTKEISHVNVDVVVFLLHMSY